MKKIVSLLAILALVFAMVAFVGCDNGNGGTSEPFTPPAGPVSHYPSLYDKADVIINENIIQFELRLTDQKI